MKHEVANPDEYISQLPDNRKAALTSLREVILNNLPDGFAEEMSYGMIGYVVPHADYPPGYHSDPKLPLPFMALASQKNHIAVYHMGIYADKELMNWFTASYPLHTKAKLDMGKSCIRFKKPEHIPYELIGELAGKLTVENWIDLYLSSFKK
jgi:uncharacterized protein YdhG (YjbR/CyaY superfamily)